MAAVTAERVGITSKLYGILVTKARSVECCCFLEGTIWEYDTTGCSSSVTNVYVTIYIQGILYTCSTDTNIDIGYELGGIDIGASSHAGVTDYDIEYGVVGYHQIAGRDRGIYV